MKTLTCVVSKAKEERITDRINAELRRGTGCGGRSGKLKAGLREVSGQAAEPDMPLLRSLFVSWSHSTNMSPLTGLAGLSKCQVDNPLGIATAGTGEFESARGLAHSKTLCEVDEGKL